jgi:hypothetical protein
MDEEDDNDMRWAGGQQLEKIKPTNPKTAKAIPSCCHEDEARKSRRTTMCPTAESATGEQTVFHEPSSLSGL